MENQSAADEPIPAPPDDIPAAPAEPGDPVDELHQIAEAAQRGRLSQMQEERAAVLLREALRGGRTGVARAVETLPLLPWLTGVRAFESVWPELTAGFRTQLFSGLAKDGSEAARRVRLSLARALFKIDVPAALKLAVNVVKDMHDKEADGISASDALTFSNVFIGRGRPWVAQLPLAELKPADGDLLVHLALLSAFAQPHPPVTQLGILKWAQENGRLDKLRETALSAVADGVGRWNAKWQNATRNEIADLPEAIAAALKPAETSDPESREIEPPTTEETAEETGEATPRKERPVYVSREEEARLRAQEEGGAAPPEPQEMESADDEEKEDESNEPRRTREPRDRREPRQQQSRGAQPFNVTQALRQIESHVNSLRVELENAKSKLRSRDFEGQRAQRRPDVPVIEGEPTPEELARLNRQLELRNTELQTRIDELTQHAEDVAASTGALGDQPVTDLDSQLRALLALKLQEDYADFLALELERNDVVVQQHYRTLIRHLFEVLLAQGVPLK